MPEDKTQASKEVKNLYEAIDHSRNVLNKVRENQISFIREYVGSWYTTNGSEKPVPVNYLQWAVDIHTQYLVSSNPRVLISSPVKTERATAARFGLEMDHLIEEIKLGETLNEAVQAAMFVMGIVKIGMMPAKKVEIEGTQFDIGEPYAKCINFDDWVHDMSAKRLDQAAFMGHRYRVPLDWVKTCGLFKDTKDLQPTHKEGFQAFVDSEGGDRLQDIAGDRSQVDKDEYRQYIELQDIWLPFDHKTLTLRTDNVHAPLREQEWYGPEGGPYRFLGFGRVPDSSLPLAPATAWKDIHDLANEIYRKLGRQSERQKENIVYDGSEVKMAENLLKAADGTALKGHKDTVGVVETGGANQKNLAMFLQNHTLFMGPASGNIESTGGLGALSETVGQDKMIRESASVQVQTKQKLVMQFATEVIKALAWYRWNDPFLDRNVVRELPNLGTVTTRFTPLDLEADFFDFNFSIVPYSLQYESPGMKLQKLLNVVSQVIMPAMPLMQQQGIELNWEYILRDISRYGNMAEIEHWLTFREPPQMEGRQTIQPPTQSPQTTRTYRRENRSVGTPQGQRNALSQILMGAGVQPSQMNAVTGVR